MPTAVGEGAISGAFVTTLLAAVRRQLSRAVSSSPRLRSSTESCQLVPASHLATSAQRSAPSLGLRSLFATSVGSVHAAGFRSSHLSVRGVSHALDGLLRPRSCRPFPIPREENRSCRLRSWGSTWTSPARTRSCDLDRACAPGLPLQGSPRTRDERVFARSPLLRFAPRFALCLSGASAAS